MTISDQLIEEKTVNIFNHHFSAIPVLLGTLLTSAFMSTSPAIAMEKETLNFWEIAECPSEQIEIEGRVRFQYQFVEGNDRATTVFQAFWSGDAWGLASGAEYRIQGKWMEVVQESPPFVFVLNDHFQLIGKGQAENYRFYSRVRFVVNAKGEIKVDFEGDHWPCPTIAFDIWE